MKAYLDEELAFMSFASIAALHRDLVKFAKSKGIKNLPTLSMVEREVKKLDLEEESAARHGARAAVLDSMPKATVPADYPHEIWTLDEFRSPVLLRAVNPLTEKLTGVRPWVVLVADNCSRVVLARHVVRPFQYGGKVSFTEDDVLGTILGAALPALAPDVCVEYAGYLPEALRWDKAGAHRPLREKLVDHRIRVPKLPGEQPYKRGSIERLIGTTKEFFTSVRGHKDFWKPIKRTGAKKAKGRKTKNSRKYASRMPQRQPIPVEDLLSYEEFVEALDEKIHEYNHTKHRALGATPHAVHLGKFRKDRARPGRDALFLMGPRVLTCTQGGVEFGNTPFAWDSGGRQLKVGQQIMCRADPLLRGIFAEVDDDVLFLEPMAQWARNMNGADVDRERYERARELADYAAALRKERLADEVGEEAVIEVARRLEQSGKKKGSRGKRGKKGSGGNGKPAAANRPKAQEADQADEARMPPGMAGDPRKRIKVVP